MKNDKNQLVLDNEGLIHSLVVSFKPKNNTEYDDLYSAGLFGMTNAINSFEKDRGTKFTTFAYYLMKNEMIAVYKKKCRDSANRPINENVAQNRRDLKIEDYLPSLTQEERLLISYQLGGLSTLDIATRMGICRGTVYHRLNKLHRKIRKANGGKLE